MPETSKIKTNKLPFFVIVFAAIAYWSFIQFQMHQSISEADQMLENGLDSPETLIRTELPTAAQELERGRFIRDDLFPLNFVESEKAFLSAIKKDSLSARAWLELSELYLQSGDFDKARLALEKSDELDPNFPRDRSQAIVLWFLLGEDEKAIQLATRLASLGGNNVRNVIEILYRQGRPFDEVVTVFESEDRTDSEVFQTLDIIAQYDDEKIESFWLLQEEEFRAKDLAKTRFARKAKEKSKIEFAVILWEEFEPEIQQNGRLMITNPSFNQSPLNQNDFVFGWAKENGVGLIRWDQGMALRGCEDDGNLQYVLEQKSSTALKPKKNYKLRVGNFVMRPGLAQTLVCKVGLSEIDSAEIAIEIQRNGKSKYEVGEFIRVDRSCEEISFEFEESDQFQNFTLSILLRKVEFETELNPLLISDSAYKALILDEVIMIGDGVE